MKKPERFITFVNEMRYSQKNYSKSLRYEVYKEYAEKLDNLLDGYFVTSFDPDFSISTMEGYDAGVYEGIKTRQNTCGNISFELVHAILKSHGLHREDIEEIYFVK